LSGVIRDSPTRPPRVNGAIYIYSVRYFA